MKEWHRFLSIGLIFGSALFSAGCFENADDSTGETGSVPTDPEPIAPPLPEKQVFAFTTGSKLEFGGSDDSEIPKGGFSNFVGKLEVAGGALVPNGKHSLTIDMNSVFTANQEFTDTLKSDDFFAISFFPSARFNLNEAISVGDGIVELAGTFDFHGASKQIAFPATLVVNAAGDRIDLKADIPINWKDFGIAAAGESEKLIWEEAVLKLEIVATPGELQNLVLTPIGSEPQVTQFAGTQGAPQQQRGGFGGKGGGKGREDWRNMSDEERAERRRQFMAEIDTNKDGNLGKDEVPERVWQFMGAADKNGDDMISEAERTEYRAEREADRALRELNGEEPRGFGPGKGGPGGGKGGGRD